MIRASRVLAAIVCLSMPVAASAQAMEGFKAPYETVKGYITKAADQMTEANYSFKPAPEVRSFGELLGHIANANFMICSAASGMANPSAKMNHEKAATKAALQKGLAESFAFCDKAWAAAALKGDAPMDLFGMKHTGTSAMAFNTAHDFEHYGNIVTYMRLKGMVPPSSQGSGMN